MKYVTMYLVPMLLWMVLIFVSSSIPWEYFPQVDSVLWAKLIHLVYYAVLSLLVQRALFHQQRFPRLARNSYLFGILVAVVYGATDEFHQMFTQGRHAMVSDVAIDAAGACLFLVAVRVFRLFGNPTHRASLEKRT